MNHVQHRYVYWIALNHAEEPDLNWTQDANGVPALSCILYRTRQEARYFNQHVRRVEIKPYCKVGGVNHEIVL
jgi:hypothetical protein